MFPVVLVLSWLLFFAIHSGLASVSSKHYVKDHWPFLWRWYRLSFNVVALLTATPVLAMCWFSDSPSLWKWNYPAKWLYWLLMLSFFGLNRVSSQGYDWNVFMGFADHSSSTLSGVDEPFAISLVHRFVRHPWYFSGLGYIWLQDMNLHWLISCIAISAYFYVGSRLEDEKLVEQYGEAYDKYRKRIPGIIPIPGRYLTRQEADQLQKESLRRAD
eukprot:Nitzschia sp. Nitz4//scaffold1_size375055//137397//138041//NITZ4_000254-RA/size375055-processed-gene-0.339-mRNA-1//1//CDS//3329540979//2561//frame0